MEYEQDALFADPVTFIRRIPSQTMHPESESVTVQPEDIKNIADPKLRDILGYLSMHGARKKGSVTIVFANHDDTFSHAIRVPTTPLNLGEYSD